MYAVCVDADTGEIVHDLLVFEVAAPKFCHPTNSYASCTPFVEHGRVYVHFGEYGTACLDTVTGAKLWERRDFMCEDFRGPASSPIVDGNRLFINFDGIDHQFLVALDKHTGETLWRVERDIDYGTEEGDMKKAYGTPTLIEVGGEQQLISQAAIETIAYKPATGEPIWRVRNEGFNGSARPLYKQGLVFLASGGTNNKAMVVVRPDGQGDVTGTHVAWSSGKAIPRFASQIVVDGRLFMVNDSGVMSCLDAASGEPVWAKRVPGAFWASPLYAAGKIYFCSKEGQVVVIRASDEFEILAENQFPAGFNASAAAIEEALLLRSFTHLYRIEE
jgi:outer membrane protein assembly factor BamB